MRVYIGLHLGTAVLFCYSWQLSAALFAKLCVLFHMKYTATLHHFVQERMIVRGGGRACNFARFGDGRNNPPVLYLETRAKHVVQFCAVVHRKLLYLVRYKYSARSIYGRQIGVTRSSSSAYNHALLFRLNSIIIYPHAELTRKS